jgi:hypothetical protein
MWGLVLYSCNPHIWETETGRSQLSPAWATYQDLVSKKKSIQQKKSQLLLLLQEKPLFLTHTSAETQLPTASILKALPGLYPGLCSSNLISHHFTENISSQKPVWESTLVIPVLKRLRLRLRLRLELKASQATQWDPIKKKKSKKKKKKGRKERKRRKQSTSSVLVTHLWPMVVPWPGCAS